MVTINPDRLLEDLASLRKFGACGTGVIRPTLSPEDMKARKWLARRMNEAGLTSTIDGVGNVIGKSSNPGQALLIGSHTDTQPQGGWLDGALGVIYGLEVARALSEHQKTSSYAVDVASWSDEEGTYLGMLGSMSFCGTLSSTDQEQAFNYLDGTALTEALGKAGLTHAPAHKMDRNRYLAYVEAHIEQGPFLEQQSLLIGVVSTIVGMRTYKVNFTGEQNHAGTTPMNYRKDAVQTLFRFATALDKKCSSLAAKHTVWTIGDVKVKPGSPHIVPGEAEMLLQFRDPSEEQLDTMQHMTASLIEKFREEEPVEISLTELTPHNRSAEMDRNVQSILAEAAAAHVPDAWTTMPSGAGHDAQVFAPLLPTGMMFIPSIGGISHNLNENSKESDIVTGCQVLATAAETMLSRTSDEE